MDASTNDYTKLRDRREMRNRARDGIRATRQKLANENGIKPEFELDLLAMFVRNEQSAAPTMWIMAVIAGLASMFWAPKLQGCAWLLAAIAGK
ncbi:MAG: sensor histidine kinase, partial [Hyphomicrobium sp.]